MGAGPPYGNKNAEKWTLLESNKLMLDAIIESNEKEKRKINGETIEVYKNDFIGEVARELGEYHQLFDYLVNKFPTLKVLYSKLLNNLETNCFLNAKKGHIKEATAIMNLKSNHHWTDRQTFEGDINLKQNVSEIFPKELD